MSTDEQKFYSKELDKTFDSIEELKQAVSDYYERSDEFTSARNLKRKNSESKKFGMKKYHFKKSK